MHIHWAEYMSNRRDDTIIGVFILAVNASDLGKSRQAFEQPFWDEFQIDDLSTVMENALMNRLGLKPVGMF